MLVPCTMFSVCSKSEINMIMTPDLGDLLPQNMFTEATTQMQTFVNKQRSAAAVDNQHVSFQLARLYANQNQQNKHHTKQPKHRFTYMLSKKKQTTQTNILLRPWLRGEDFLLLFFVIFVNFIDALHLLHSVGELPCFLSRAAPGHGEIQRPVTTPDV